MTYDTYRYIFIGAAILCACMLVLTIVLFFTLNIRKVFGDLTGKNAKKEIKKIREDNEQSGDKRHKSSAVNRKRGKITDKISNQQVQQRQEINTGIITAKISTQELAQETELLDNAISNETSVLSEGLNETSLLDESINETTILNENRIVSKVFEIEHDITFIHTNEVIN